MQENPIHCAQRPREPNATDTTCLQSGNKPQTNHNKQQKTHFCPQRATDATAQYLMEPMPVSLGESGIWTKKVVHVLATCFEPLLLSCLTLPPMQALHSRASVAQCRSRFGVARPGKNSVSLQRTRHKWLKLKFTGVNRGWKFRSHAVFTNNKNLQFCR